MKILKDVPIGQLAGKICTVIDITTRLPVEIWFSERARAYDTTFMADLWVFEGPLSQGLRISLDGTDSQRNCNIVLLDDKGQLLANDDSDYGPNSSIEVVPQGMQGQDNYIIAAFADGDVTPYSLSLNMTDPAKPIQSGQWETARLEDGISWAFEGEAGQMKYRKMGNTPLFQVDMTDKRGESIHLC